MVNATFALLFTPPVFWYANSVAFPIFAMYLLLSSKFVQIHVFFQRYSTDTV